jgi:hypothetical protein
MGRNPQLDKNETKKSGAQLTDIQKFFIYLLKGLLFAGFFVFVSILRNNVVRCLDQS